MKERDRCLAQANRKRPLRYPTFLCHVIFLTETVWDGEEGAGGSEIMRAILVGELRKESRQGGKKLLSAVPERKVFLDVRPSPLSATLFRRSIVICIWQRRKSLFFAIIFTSRGGATFADFSTWCRPVQGSLSIICKTFGESLRRAFLNRRKKNTGRGANLVSAPKFFPPGAPLHLHHLPYFFPKKIKGGKKYNYIWRSLTSVIGFGGLEGKGRR